MVVNDRPLKRLKRRISADFYDFLAFPEAATAGSGEPFRTSVRSFLSKHARVPFPPSLFPCLLTWQILFRIGDPVAGGADSAVALDIVEEDVTRSRSRSVYCDQCRVVGWSAHPVCRKRYHFIIRANSSPIEGYQKPCSICGCLMHLLDSRCKSCNTVITAEEVEEWVYHQFEDSTHLLHGVVHSNGYGHLLTVNGREGGSNVLSGCDIMNFWDRLCRTLSVRKVSVMDVSKKYGLEYRLLHAITRGHPWYGEWGYNFGAGSYAVTLDAYQKAVDTLASVPLSLFFFQGREAWSRLQTAIAYYQSLSESGLATLKDLFSFLLSLIHETYKPKSKNSRPNTTTVLCAWTRNDVERVEQAMIKVLLAAAGDSRWVTRRAMRGAMCKVASPELLDYCLKHLRGRLTSDGMVVQSRCNPISEAVEFRLSSVHNLTALEVNHPPGEQFIGDLKFFYDSILQPQTMVTYRPQATREVVADSAAKLLDCKQFVKDFKLDDESAVANPFAIHLWCHVEVEDEPKGDPAPPPPPPPPELIVLPANATFADLKSEVSKVFQEVYALFKRFQAEELVDYGTIEDSMSLKLLVGPSRSVHVTGKCQGTHGLSRFRMERGVENWTVDCMCGAKDDDGEKMLACDTCGVWQHTRCAGIDSSDGIPAKFVCVRCVNKYNVVSEMVPEFSEEANAVTQSSTQSSTTCRDEAIASNAPRVGSVLALAYGVG